MEKVVVKMRQYDFCAYRGCKKGRFTTNSRLYRFPAALDPRLAIWIENSGNKRLKFLARSTLRVCGLCQDHFDPIYIKPENNYLSRDAVPKKFVEKVEAPKKFVEKVESPKKFVEKVEVPKKFVEKVEVPKKFVEKVEVPKKFVEKVVSAEATKVPFITKPETKYLTRIAVPKRLVTKIRVPAEAQNVPKIIITCKSPETLNIPELLTACTTAVSKFNNATAIGKDRKIEIDLTKATNENKPGVKIEPKDHQPPDPPRKPAKVRPIKKSTSSLRKQIAHLKRENSKLKRKNMLCEKTIRVLRRKLRRASSTTNEHWPAKKTKKDDDFLGHQVYLKPIARRTVALTFLRKK